MNLLIEKIEGLSPSLKRFTFTAPGARLPVAAAGAHILVTIPDPARTAKNAYSLVSTPGTYQNIVPSAYQIIVRRTANSRGGSAWLHEHAAVGMEIEVAAPQNLFPLARTAGRHLLLSGGIGVTPFLSYLPAMTAPFSLHHLCKPEDEAAFRALLPMAANVTIHTSRRELDLPRLLGTQTLATHLYVCGPEAFMQAVREQAGALGWPESRIHMESFGHGGGGRPFTVHLKRTGLTLRVGPQESLLEAMEAANLRPPCLCRGGACGECELPVLSGIPEHHDHVLTPAQRAANNAILTCVSRAETDEIVLDF